MSILSSIFSKIFPSSHPAAPTAAANAPAAPAAPAVAPSAPAPAAAPPTLTPMGQLDVASLLDSMAAKSPEKLNWKTSIVDLMKLLGIDSSLTARKSLAEELHYSGDMSDSASMNIWLHKEVMNKVAANGGKVPADLKD